MTDNIASIHSAISGVRLEPNERIVSIRTGFKVELFNEHGEFNKLVKLPDDTGDVFMMRFNAFPCIDIELNEDIKSFYQYLLPRYLPGTMRHFHGLLQVFTESVGSGISVDHSIENMIRSGKTAAVTIAKKLVQYLVLNEYQGISLEKAEETLKLEGYSGGKNNYITLFTLDEEMGPFTREELRVLNAALKSEKIVTTDRLILSLCINFGLRPIQISLLKKKDFVDDEVTGVKYLNIPRVKQSTVFRREQFTKRAVDDELACLLREVISFNDSAYSDFDVSNEPLIYRKFGGVAENFYNLKHQESWNDSGKDDFAHHVRPSSITARISAISQHVPLSPRTGKPFNLFPYRFRYTVGTNAVVGGMCEEEVAELLDHSSILCVKHYFRYIKEMWEILEDATIKRTEQNHFTAAWSRHGDLSGNIYGKEVIEIHSFTAIGNCQKEAGCFLEPAVACYTCDKFCPNKDSHAHENALISLKDRKEVVATRSTTSLSKQLDEAIAGCRAAIAYSSGVDVVNIHQGGIEDG